ncbi:amino acid adenylation domain-containing protein [Gynuella sp.]|uniref:amino acid adenylation domain-containing protein n=1 Tax=Gynuella sp. TaxID=2969146 RepID=UPI003D12FE64
MDEKRKKLIELLNKRQSSRSDGDIAIIGVAGRYPMADNLDEFWENLQSGKSCIQEIPPERWDWREHYHPDAKTLDKSYSKWAGFIRDADKFDASFFQVSPLVAEAMDPQERVFLEVAWSAVEDAAYTRDQLRHHHPVGVFVGIMNSNYEWMGGEAAAKGVLTDAHSNFWSIANRVSYIFDFRGPSMAVDTACSSSLTAIHLACESLKRKECRVAVAGGVNLILHPMHLSMLSNHQMISKGQQLKSFGADADGFVDGEGAGAIVLKPLVEAIAAGDRVYAVIKGSAINAGGKTSGYTVPNPRAQTDVIHNALLRGNVDFNSVSYIEAHGTGTALGDPIEISGLSGVSRVTRTGSVEMPAVDCAIGSVKSNIGHLESAAGVAGITKVLLQMRHKTLVPSLHSNVLNPKIDFSDSRFQVQQSLTEWLQPSYLNQRGQHVSVPRRAGVSSFGGGGANAHVVLEEYVAPARTVPVESECGPYLILLSAKNVERLREYAANLREFLDHHMLSLQDVAYTLQTGREVMEVRLAIIARETEELKRRITSYLNEEGSEKDRSNEGIYDSHIGSAVGTTIPEDVSVAVDHNDLPVLARCWVQGKQPDWSRLSAWRGAEKVSLPTYPFARKRYWIPPLPVGQSPDVTERMSETSSEPSHQGAVLSLYRPYWCAEDHTMPITSQSGRRQTVLIIDNGDDLAQRLILSLEQQHDTDTVIRLKSGLSDYVAALTGISHVDLIYHLGGLPSEPLSTDELAKLKHSQDHGLLTLFRLIRQLDQRGFCQQAMTLKVITNNVFGLPGQRVTHPYGASLHGLCQVIPSEYPLLNVVGIDIDLPDILEAGASDDIDHLVTMIRQEVATENGRAVMFRQGVRYRKTLQAVEVPLLEPPPFRQQGVYCILGGASGVGIEFSRYLAKEYHAKIVWIGRSVLNEQQQQHIADIEAVGGEVVYLRADGCQLQQMTRAVASVRQRFGRINGVIHSAMIFNDREINRMDERQFFQSIAPKITGSVILNQVFADESLDFMLFFSSTGSFEGGIGNSGYIPGTTFKDAYAHYLDQLHSFPVRVINWGYWGSVGSGAQPGLERFFKAQGIGTLSPQQGIDSICRILANRPVQLMSIVAETTTLERLGLDTQTRATAYPPQLAQLLSQTHQTLRNPLPADITVDNIRRDFKAMERLCEPLLLGVFQEMGVFRRGGERHDISVLFTKLRVIEKFRRLFVALLNILQHAGYLQVYDREVETLAVIETVRPQACKIELISALNDVAHQNPEIEPTVTLVRLFLESYPAILTGKIMATEIMFPGSSMKLVQNFYRGNAVTDAYNMLVCQAAQTYVEHRAMQLATGEKIRIVELGAGTGATTGKLLPMLAKFAGRISYTYTDISSIFLDYGKEQYSGQYPFVSFKALNLEHDFETEGFAPGTFDLIVATNVVHATKNLRSTIGKAKALLKTSGWLVLNELTDVVNITTVTGGVLDGWWLFDDESLRIKDAPLACPQTWERILREAGFDEVVILDHLDSGARNCGQNIIIAESDGVIQTVLETPCKPSSETVVADAPLVDSLAVLATPVEPSSPGFFAEKFRGWVQEQLNRIIVSSLKLDEAVDSDRPLAEYGFDSITGMKVVNALSEQFDVDVAIKIFFEYQTIRELADYLIQEGIFPMPEHTVTADSHARFRTAPAAGSDVESVSTRRGYNPDILPVPEHIAAPEVFPLSHGQRALWIIEQVSPNNYAYNLPLAFRISSDVEVPVLRQALQSLMNRHDSLRTTIQLQNREPVQQVVGWQALALEQKYPAINDEQRLRDTIIADVQQPFDLSVGPLMKAILYTLPNHQNVLLLNFHHIIFDGISILHFLQELEATYALASQGQTINLPMPKVGFKDFVAWQHDMLSGPEGQTLEDYWLRQMPEQIPLLALPLDRPRGRQPGYRGAALEGRISADITTALKSMAGRERTTLFNVMLAGYMLLLHRYSGQNQILVGTPTAGRPDSRFEQVFGYFMNMVVIKGELSGNPDIRTFLSQLNNTVMEALDHAHYPLIKLAEKCNEHGKYHAHGLIQTAFYFQNWVDKSQSTGLIRDIFPGVHQTGEFEITLEVVEEADGCRYCLKYNPDLFDHTTIQQLGQHFTLVLEQMVRNAEQPVAAISMLTDAEQQRLLVDWNRTDASYPSETSVIDLFEQQAVSHALDTAVIYDSSSLSYRELKTKTHQLATYLQQHGATSGSIVGVFIDRSLDLIVALLGVMKAGATYVPLDPTYPADRLAYMIDDAGITMLVTQSRIEDKLPACPAERIRIDQDWPNIERSYQDDLLTNHGWRSESLAYIIYTSGSTGNPKGVQISHRALTNFLCAMAKLPGIGAADHLLAVTTVCFDIAGLELYLPLIVGARLEIAPTAELKNGLALARRLESSQATVMQATPATWRMLLGANWRGNPALKILCGGEALSADLADILVGCGKEVWNLFGPTETTIWSALSRVQQGKKVTIGRPIDNTRFYVLDDRLQPVPIGVTGHLYIGGDGLSEGYFNRPELTARKFIDNPFDGSTGSRLYNTGDLVRYLADGELEYVGRDDFQVKIRGYRVELEEIETQVRKLPGIEDVVVIARSLNDRHQVLQAYCTFRAVMPFPDTETFPGLLSQWLPDYMVPAAFYVLREFPQTLNRKVDRQRISTTDVEVLLAQYGIEGNIGRPNRHDDNHPLSAWHDALCQALTDRLGLMVAQILNLSGQMVSTASPLGTYGFDSIGFTQLSVAVNEEYELEINPTLFYQYSSIDSIARYLLQYSEDRIRRKHPDIIESPMAVAPTSLSARSTTTGSTIARHGRLSDNDPVVIIGIGGKMPQSPSLEVFWQNLLDEQDLIQEIPSERWDWRAYFGDSTDAEKSNSRWGGFIGDVDKFDAAFFGISPREAAQMDPQQRLLLEVVWQTIEDAGYQASSLSGSKVGVFVGATNADYAEVQRQAGQESSGHTLTGLAHSILPNRISYLLNLRGPSCAVDTACSSSLVAIHQAVAAILHDDCYLALAGGVSLILDPKIYVALSQGGMLSVDGRCKAFDRSANGYVRGEGAGMVLLKRLSQAEHDGDHIYAVVKGSAQSHGGHTNSLTSPSAAAQAELLVDAYRKAGVDVSTIGYIEAHGTGTALGDPIEINGLKTAFNQLSGSPSAAAGLIDTDSIVRVEHHGQPYCGIGSVKTNIGHLEAAAAVAGVLKTLLALKYGKLPANIHFNEQNPYIDLNDSPFYIVRQTQEWPPFTDAQGRELPRRAGVSSFGFGGAYAHLVLEEYRVDDRVAIEHDQYVIVLSARTDSALRVSVTQMIGFIETGLMAPGHAPALADIAYTLQTGRESMEVRLAVVVRSREELLERLKTFLAADHDEHKQSSLWCYASRSDAEMSWASSIKGRAWQRLVADLAAEQEYASLASLWVSGEPIEWTLLYRDADRLPVRVSLPTYPFSKDRHWVQNVMRPERFSAGRTAALHPTLLDTNISTFEQQAFEKTLSGEEFYLTDHMASGRKVLPGVVYLEMARQAGIQSCPGSSVQRLENILWAQPVVMSDTRPRILQLVLRPTDTTAGYEVTSVTDNGETLVHAQGKLVFQSSPESWPDIGQLDIEAVRLHCQWTRTGQQCYDFFRSVDFQYGPAFQVIQQLQGNKQEVLAYVSLPQQQQADFSQYLLHPSMLDGALQAVAFLINQDREISSVPYLPFAIGSMTFVSTLPEQGYVHVTLTGHGHEDGSVLKFNIRMISELGEIMVDIRDYTLKAVPRSKPVINGSHAVVPSAESVHLFQPVWETNPLPDIGDQTINDNILVLNPSAIETVVLTQQLRASGLTGNLVTVVPGDGFEQCGEQEYRVNFAVRSDYLRLLADLADKHALPTIVLHPAGHQLLAGSQPEPDKHLQDSVYTVWYFCQAWIERGDSNHVRYLYSISRDSERYPFAIGLKGFARSIRQENPHIDICLIEYDDPRTVLFPVGELHASVAACVRYQNGRRLIERWRRYAPPSDFQPSASVLIRQNGVYLMTGGAGGLGFHFAEYLIRAGAATVIIVGRSVLSSQQRQQFDTLQVNGAQILYERVDVSNCQTLQRFIGEIQADYPALNGIIHAAGVLRDGLVLKKTDADMNDVLQPKVHGSVWLDHLTRHMDLDFFVLFSSTAAVFGNVGQADYAYANSFLDGFAHRREVLRAAGKRSGQTISVNWPLWQDGGMQASDQIKRLMWSVLGMTPLQTAEGMVAFEQIGRSGQNQLLVASGDLAHIESALPGLPEVTQNRLSEPPPSAAVRQQPVAIETSDLKIRTEDLLRRVIATELQISADSLATNKPFERLGLDSIIIMSLTRKLEGIFGELSKTLFFECQTLTELTQYFLEHHHDKLINHLFSESVANHQDVIVAKQTTSIANRFDHNGMTPNPAEMVNKISYLPRTEDDIAIIGVSGRYPQAENLTEFWENLKQGRDCIEEIPADRWNHQLIYDPDPNTFGKSYGRWGGFLKNIDQFDPLFFRMSKMEAEYLDPQERLFLESVWNTLEDAGYTREGLRSFKTGVFVGLMYGHYQLHGVDQAMKGESPTPSSSYASIANRTSFFFDFSGPSMAMDTMCSSSLYAIHLACLSIRNGDCDVAFAGGTNISSHPLKYIQLSYRNFLSTDGRCRSFGEGGDGYVPGEGVGTVLLKRLDQAKADNDQIYAIVAGSAVNHGGTTNGFSVPNPKAQGDLIQLAIQRAGINASDIGYVEAHGTGTSLGDPIEMTGLLRAYKGSDWQIQRTPIGSVKSNIGHTESAAGIAGVTKVLLQMKHRQLVPSLHAEVTNPNIKFTESPFYVQRELAPWPAESDTHGRPKARIAAVSAFGAGGANGHVLLREYLTATNPADRKPGPYLFLLSARSLACLQEYSQRMIDFLTTAELQPQLSQVAYVSQVGREAMKQRLALVVYDHTELVAALQQFQQYHDSIEHGWYATSSSKYVPASPELINDALQQQSLEELARQWVQGVEIDWQRLYPDGTPTRVSIPNYPFERERCWAEVAEFSQMAYAGGGQPTSVSVADHRVVLPAGGTTQRDANSYLLVKDWQTASLTPTVLPKRVMLILATTATQNLAQILCECLSGSRVLMPDQLTEFKDQPDDHWQRYDGVLDLAGCAEQRSPALDRIGCLQKLIEYGHRNGLVLMGVSKGLESFHNDRINLEGALLAGLYRSLQSEYRHLRSMQLDVDWQISDEQVAAHVLAELQGPLDDPQVCYRDGQRYVPTLHSLKTAVQGGKKPVFRADQVLFITGGTRGLGYLCAQHFVDHYGVKNLVLTGRETLPPKAHWQALDGQNSSTAEKIKAILALEAKGVSVRVLDVPLQDQDAFSRCVEDVKQQMGSIAGVIHCAGLGDFDNPAFIRKTTAGMERVLEPKVAGLEVMMSCLQHEPLQFFALFSSVAAVVPGLAAGQMDYAMANAYMDYVAQANHHRLPMVSLQWPSWKESGMGEIKTPAYRQTGLSGLSNEEGLALLDQVLDRHDAPVVLPAVVAAQDWDAQLLLQPARSHSAKPRADKPHTLKAVSTSDQLAIQIQQWLMEMFSKELKIAVEKFEPDASFQDFGVDSIILAQMSRTISQTLTEDLDPSVMFEHDTFEGLSAWLAEHYVEVLSGVFNATVAEPETDAAEPDAHVENVAAMPATEPQVVSMKTMLEPARMGSGVVDEDIAVVGVSCRFPGAESVAEYWQLLAQGQSAIQNVPYERWGYKSPFNAALLEDIRSFDHDFFLIPRVDAEAMDPQALLVLEETLRLIYHSGYTHQQLKGRDIGVYIGGRTQHWPGQQRLSLARNPIVAVGQNYLSANISQFFDLRGPSLVLDTACSSALVGMNMAVQSLRSGDISAAIVGGVSLLSSDIAHKTFSQRNILSREPAFHIFDQRANGVVLGEGVGLVMLKTLSQAQVDGDQIYAVIKALAINNDGRTAGPATPNIKAQKQVMEAALRKSGLRPDDVQYLEVNGSGSEVTDLLELKAIESVYRHDSKVPCELGSMKPNIGHPLCAEGIASFLKVVLMLKHRQMVPFLSGQVPLEHYDLSASSFHFRREISLPGRQPMVAAVNSFADGGTNAHVILQSWTATNAVRSPLTPPQLNKTTLSAPYQSDGDDSEQNPVTEGSAAEMTDAPSLPVGPVNNIWKRPSQELLHA